MSAGRLLARSLAGVLRARAAMLEARAALEAAAAEVPGDSMKVARLAIAHIEAVQRYAEATGEIPTSARRPS